MQRFDKSVCLKSSSLSRKFPALLISAHSLPTSNPATQVEAPGDILVYFISADSTGSSLQYIKLKYFFLKKILFLFFFRRLFS